MPRFTVLNIGSNDDHDIEALARALQAGNFWHDNRIDFPTEVEAWEATRFWATGGGFL